MTRRPYEINMNMTIHGWNNVQTMRDIFRREFNPSDGIYHESTPRLDLFYQPVSGSKDSWGVWVKYEAPRKYVTSQVDSFRMFLRGVHATMHHLQDVATL